MKQIAEENNRDRALAFLENREGAPVHSLKREKSIDHVYSNRTPNKLISSKRIQPDKQSFVNRKASVDPVANKRDDIFGNSVSKDLFPSQDTPIDTKEINMMDIKKQLVEENKDLKPIRLLKNSAQKHSYDNRATQDAMIPPLKTNINEYGTE